MDQRAIDECFNVEDNDEAYKCLKKVIKNDKSSCQPKLILLVQENCEPCEAEKAARQADIDAGIVEVLSLDEPTGLALAKAIGIDYVPALLFLDCENKVITPSV